LLIVYTAGRTELGQFVTWWKRQSGQRRAYPSRWPAPPGWDQDRTYGLPKDESPGARANPNRDRDAGTPRAERGHSAGKVRADRPHDAGKVPPSRAGFRAGADSDSGTPPKPPSQARGARGAKGRRSNGSSPRQVDEARIRELEVAWSQGDVTTEAFVAEVGRQPRMQYDHLAVTEDSFAVGPEPAEVRR
jgi:hypothetical protein